MLSTNSFGNLRSLNWDVLQTAGLMDDVEQLLSVSGWHKLLTMEERAYRDLTLEFLASFERKLVHHIWDDPTTIRFQLLGREYHFSYTELALRIGLYTLEYTALAEYRNLIFLPLLGESQHTR